MPHKKLITTSQLKSGNWQARLTKEGVPVYGGSTEAAAAGKLILNLQDEYHIEVVDSLLCPSCALTMQIPDLVVCDECLTEAKEIRAVMIQMKAKGLQ